MKKRISATEAARSFSDLLNRVRYRGQTFVIERAGEPICELSPVKPAKFTVADFVSLIRSLPRPDDEYLDLVEEITKTQAPLSPSPWER